ncbi:mucin-5AC-like [Danio aesculapii]|uniref:mucin-5AC-like n=1 Tax=Danio aesculapii TaxID=1142201 RepID=UPI0024BF61FD|nr:mucin-5AC-like [Danio aesculapii]
MEIFIFIIFLLITEVQSYNAPTVRVSSDVISEFSSVKISCETPAGVTVNQCYFTINREVKNIKVSPSCELEFTGDGLLIWAGGKSPQSVDINCYYTTNERGINEPSSHSAAATVTVLGLPQARLSASASVLQETDTVELNCENTEDLKMEMCFFNKYGRESNSKVSSSCQLSLTASQIRDWSGDQSSSVNITCFYTVKKGQNQTPSPHSDPVTVTVQTSTPTTTAYTTATAIKTTTLTVTSTPATTENTEADLQSQTDSTIQTTVSTENSTPKASQTDTESSTSAVISTTSIPTTVRADVSNVQTFTAQKDQPVSRYKVIWLVVLICTGVGVILSGLLGIICVCWFARKRRRKCNNRKSTNPDVSSQGIGVSCSGPPELYSLITSAPATSQPVFEDLSQHNTDPRDTVMTSVNPMYQCSDVSVNKKQRGNIEQSEDVYHLYCTIPEKPVQSSTGDKEYSLIQMHQ